MADAADGEGQGRVLWQVFAAAVASRLLVFGAAWAIDAWRGVERTLDQALCQFDCGWYLGLIANGYDRMPHDHAGLDAANWAFFPAYPMALRGLVEMSGGDPLILAYALNNTLFVATAVLLYATYREVIGRDAALWAELLFCASPFTLYNSYPYAEAVFNFQFIAFFALALQRRWIAAAAVGALVSASRPLGVFAVVILVGLVLRAHGLRGTLGDPARRAELFAAVMLLPPGLFAYMAFLHHHVGDALVFKHVQIAWDRAFGNPLEVLWAGQHWGGGWQRHHALAAVAGLGLAGVLAWKRRHGEAFFLAVVVLVPLSTMLQSMPRFAFALWLPYLALGLLLASAPRLRWALLAGLLISWLVYLGGWLAAVPGLT